jgi:hypothetical protein
LYGEEVLQFKSEFRYLGVVLNRCCSMSFASLHGANALSRATHDLYARAKELGLRRQVGAMLRLYQVYATPAAMYGCQVWGTAYLNWEEPLESVVERRRLAFFRRQLGLRQGVDRHVLLREAGAKPLLTYWARSLVRFYNKIRDRERVGASQLLSDALESDLILARSGGCGSCWSAELAQGLGQLDPAWGQAVLQGHPIDQASVMQAVYRTLVVGPWKGGMVSILHRKRSLYAAMCSPGQRVGLPDYVDLSGLRRAQVRQVARFRTSCHNLGIERARWWREGQGGPSREQIMACSRCSEQWCAQRSGIGEGREWRGALGSGGRPVDDEYHLLFECEATAAVRERHWRLLQDLGAVPDVLAALGAHPSLAEMIADCMDLLS